MSKEDFTKILTMVNIGNTEKPLWVPEKALQPLTPEGREWWGMVAEW